MDISQEVDILLAALETDEPISKASRVMAAEVVRRLRDENRRLGGASTMMACASCGLGVPPRDAVKNMCAVCASARIDELEGKMREYFKHKDAYWEWRKKAAENNHNQICSAASETLQDAENSVRKALEGEQ